MASAKAGAQPLAAPAKLETPRGAGGGVQAGGLAVLEDRRHCRQDARLILRAVREGWPVSQERRPQIVRRLADVIEQAQNPRAVALCAKVFVEMDRQELRAVKAAVALVKAQQAAEARQAGGRARQQRRREVPARPRPPG